MSTIAATSARSSVMEDPIATEFEETIKVADLLNMTTDLPKSKIRRDMFGNLRPVPRNLLF
jgi:hypothetical protein